MDAQAEHTNNFSLKYQTGSFGNCYNIVPRTSYLPHEIQWGQRFEQMLIYRKDQNKFQVYSMPSILTSFIMVLPISTSFIMILPISMFSMSPKSSLSSMSSMSSMPSMSSILWTNITMFHVLLHRYSVDCGRASIGLFLGIMVVVVTIISLILFFVFISEEGMRLTAVRVAVLSEVAMYGVTGVATVVAMLQMRVLWHDSARTLELDSLLLVVAQTGVFLHATFSTIGALLPTLEVLALLASLATLLQTSLQTLFILDASCRVATTSLQVQEKPGRQAVTFLLMCNLAMWLLNTLETSRTDAHPAMVAVYGGGWAWPLLSHLAMPLAIFYRFHSTVCLFEIWKKAFKLRRGGLGLVTI